MSDMHLELSACSPRVLAQLDYAVVTPRRKYLAHVERERCWLCDKVAPEVTFRSIAHVVSQALGNRSWCTREECDVCNRKIGALESDMVASTNGYRLTSAYHGKGSLRFRRPSHRSFLRALDGSRNVFLLQARDELPLLERTSESEFVIKIPTPAYRPLSICKVLSRLAMLLCPDLRTSHQHLIRWLRDEVALEPQLLLCGDSKGAATFKPTVKVFRYIGETELDSNLAVVLVYEGLFYWYVLPSSSEGLRRIFIDGSLLDKKLDLHWSLSVLDEQSLMPSRDIRVSVTQLDGPLIVPNARSEGGQDAETED